MSGQGYHVAVVGATGAVGNEMIKILEERDFPVRTLKLLASSKSAGRRLPFKGEEILVEELKEDAFQGVEIGLFSPGAGVSRRFAPIAVKAGVVVIDNTSAFRMDPEVPLVVPEVNPHAALRHQGLIANPNCSTIQMVVALKPIHDQAKIRRIVVSTYQSVSGTGKKGMDELLEQTKALLGFKEVVNKVYPYQIAFNCLPHIDEFNEEGYSKEELKMMNETRKIMEDDSIRITATTVRVPVFHCHSESVNIETEKKLTVQEVRDILSKAPGVVVYDNVKQLEYPLAIQVAGKDEVYVGRIREDTSIPNGLNLWIVADNLRKGAALNAVQIAELLIREGKL